MLTLYNVQSQDGYISEKDGSEDFIPDSFWPYTLKMLAEYDIILLGRKTYDTIQTYEDSAKESFDALPGRKFIVTQNKNFIPKAGYDITYSPEEILTPDLNIVVTSGPTLNDYLLSRNLVDRITYHEVPIRIGGGIKPYTITDISVEIIKFTH